MNRLTSPRSTTAADQHQSSQRQMALAGLRQARVSSGSHAYHLLAPVHYEPNYAYPLLIWLHSAGDDERQLRRIMPHVSLRNYVSVAPRGVVAEPGGRSFCWSSEHASLESAWQSVHEALEIARKQYNVHPERVFLAGLNDGGTMALRLALGQPEHFAGAASVGGAFPMNCGALGRLNSVRQLPLLLMRGLESAVYTEEQLCDEIRLFHAARMQVHLRQYTCGDELLTPMLRDLDAWLMEQVTGMPVLSDSDAATAS